MHAHPWQDEAHAAVHGGLWRAAYEPRSALGLAAVLGYASARADSAGLTQPGLTACPPGRSSATRSMLSWAAANAPPAAAAPTWAAGR